MRILREVWRCPEGRIMLALLLAALLAQACGLHGGEVPATGAGGMWMYWEAPWPP